MMTPSEPENLSELSDSGLRGTAGAQKMPGEVDDTSPRPVAKIVDQFMGLVMQGPPYRDSLAEKFTPKHIEMILKAGELQEQHEFELKKQAQDYQERFLRSLIVLSVLAMCLVFGLCWLFLRFDKIDQVYQILAILFVGGGGVGVGTGINRLSKSGPSDSGSKTS